MSQSSNLIYKFIDRNIEVYGFVIYATYYYISYY